MFTRKVKYKFDHEKLSYIIIKQSIWKTIYKSFIIIIPSILISLVFLFILLNTIDSPYEKKLQAHCDSLLLKYNILDKKIVETNISIAQIAQNDNYAYRPFFEMDSIPQSVRMAGFGGTDKYKEFRQYQHSDLLTDMTKKVDIIAKQLYIQSKSYDEVIENIKNKEKMLECIPSFRPVKLEDITAECSFGMRLHPILGIYRMHKGVDLCADENTEIYAAGSGIVVNNTFQESLGNYVKIDHGYGYQTVYGHLNKSLVNVGDSVKQGDLIALMGTTGISNVVHVHYEVHKNGEPVNPLNLFYNDLTDIEYECLISNNSEATSYFMK